MKTLCSSCGSPRVVYFRLDSDWYSGGDLTRLNDDEDYQLFDPDESDTLDIEGTYCIPCGAFTGTQKLETDNE